jgi:hypothetical protein
MKRLLQGLALLQVVLLVALGWRIVAVWTTPLPEPGEVPDLPAVTSIPPPRPAPKPSEAVTQAVVEHDLFDEARGQSEPDIVVDGEVPAAPVPPPSTVKLTGVMVLEGEPVGFLLDTNLKPEQQAVRKGDMFGEYEVGDITPMSLLLLGTQNQQFQIPLKVEAAGGGAPAVAAPGGPPPPPRTPGTRPTPPPKPVAAARPAPGKGDGNTEPDTKTMSARERAQAIAQRNAELRKQNQNPKGAGGEDAEAAAEAEPNPVQARLEALRQLREAAKTR